MNTLTTRTKRAVKGRDTVADPAVIPLELCLKAAQLFAHSLMRLPPHGLRFSQRERLHRSLLRVRHALDLRERRSDFAEAGNSVSEG
jgi:hypothetical protein